MIVSLKWIQDYVDAKFHNRDDIKVLCEKLTTAGLEIASVEFLEDKYKNIVTAEVVGKKQHPQADRLSLCQVKAGEDIFKIVCGALNHKAGDKVILAKLGAKVYVNNPEKTFEIKKSKIRGEASEGMLCSPEELGVEGDNSGIIILPKHTKTDIAAAEALGLNDVILDIELTPNRGDCQSHLGVAREIAALYRTKLKYPKWIVNENKKTTAINKLLDISKVDFEICPRYMARVVKGVKIAQSPTWLVEKINSIGIRSINNIVDITNYVLHEYGQPLHAFDLDKLKKNKAGKAEIIVRQAKDKEQFITLDEQKRELSSGDILICDAERPVALGGIMGGMNSEISSDTVDVLIESAIFNPVSIRHTTRRLDIFTDSSARFEKQVDAYAVHKALDRAAELMRELADGQIVPGFIDACNFSPENRKVVSITVAQINSILGTNLSFFEIERLLSALEFEVQRKGEASMEIFVPTWRKDVNEVVDIAEEVGRSYGLDNINGAMPSFHENFYVKASPFAFENKLKKIMLAQGMQECITYSFQSNNLDKNTFLYPRNSFPIRLSNPVSEEFRVMRRSVFSSLIQTAQYNVSRGNNSLRLFELGTAYSSSKEAQIEFSNVDQKRKISGLISGMREELEVIASNYRLTQESYDFFDIKNLFTATLGEHLKAVKFVKMPSNAVFHMGESVEVYSGEKFLGFFGRLNPVLARTYDLPLATYVMELDVQLIEEMFKNKFQFQAISKYPRVSRDLACMVDKKVLAGDIIACVEKIKIRAVCDVNVFDVFSGKDLSENKKSVGIRITYQSQEKTLTDKEINKFEHKILQRLSSELGAGLRPA